MDFTTFSAKISVIAPKSHKKNAKVYYSSVLSFRKNKIDSFCMKKGMYIKRRLRKGGQNKSIN